MNRGRFALLCLMGGLGVIGCSVRTVGVSPSFDFARVRRVAVLEFEPVSGLPESSHSFTGNFERLLVEEGWTVVERAQVNALIREMELGFSGAITAEQATKLGNLLGIQALVLGKVTLYSPHETGMVMVDVKTETQVPVTRQRRVESVVNGVTQTQVFDEIVDYRPKIEKERRPHVYRIQAEAGAVVKMVDVETAEVFWVGSDTQEATNVHVAAERVCESIVDGLKRAIKEREKRKVAQSR